MSLAIAAQLYTVREAAEADFWAAVWRLSDLGFEAVELAGLHGFEPEVVQQALESFEMRCVSAHVHLADLRENLNYAIKVYRNMGAEYIVCPYLPPNERGNAQAYHKLARELDRIGAKCKRKGMQLCYHHHDFELEEFEGKPALSILLENTDPDNLQLEADTYWLKAGGVDPAAYLHRWVGRVPLIHIKDMTASEPPTFAAIGQGLFDWPAIFKMTGIADTRWHIIEQDETPGDPFASLQQSLDYLKEKGWI